jgi:hypothetical protein
MAGLSSPRVPLIRLEALGGPPGRVPGAVRRPRGRLFRGGERRPRGRVSVRARVPALVRGDDWGARGGRRPPALERLPRGGSTIGVAKLRLIGAGQ